MAEQGTSLGSAMTMHAASPAADVSFAALVDQYRDRIRRYIDNLVHDPDEAEDLTQETFVRAYNGLPSLHDPGAASAWLYRIATHLCYDRFRRSSRPALPLGALLSDEHEAELPDQDAPRLDLAMEQAEMSECVRGYLDDLPDEHRIAILLHDVEGLTNPEIAAMLGTSVANVKIRLHRARGKLRAALDAGCAFSVDDRGVLVCEPSSPSCHG